VPPDLPEYSSSAATKPSSSDRASLSLEPEGFQETKAGSSYGSSGRLLVEVFESTAAYDAGV